MQTIVRGILLAGICILVVFAAGCSETPRSLPDTPVATAVLTPAATPAPEVIYVYVTVTVTPTTPTPVPTPTKEEIVSSDSTAYHSWRYQYVSKDDGALHIGPVATLLTHLDHAPDEEAYQIYYQSSRRWKEDLETLIDNVQTSVPSVRSDGMSRAIGKYNTSLTLQNGTIRTLDIVMTNWEFEKAARVTNGIVVNITNATQEMDDWVADQI